MCWIHDNYVWTQAHALKVSREERANSFVYDCVGSRGLIDFQLSRASTVLASKMCCAHNDLWGLSVSEVMPVCEEWVIRLYRVSCGSSRAGTVSAGVLASSAWLAGSQHRQWQYLHSDCQTRSPNVSPVTLHMEHLLYQPKHTFYTFFFFFNFSFLTHGLTTILYSFLLYLLPDSIKSKLSLPMRPSDIVSHTS